MKNQNERRPALPSGVPDHWDEKGSRFAYRWAWWYTNDFIVVRYDAPEGDGKTIRPYHRTEGGAWCVGQPAGPLVLYGLNTLPTAPGATVYIAEGEKCAAALHALGLPCVASAGGAQSVSKTDWTPFQQVSNATILPDNDDPGATFANKVAAALATLRGAPSLSIVPLPNLPEGGDVVDWLQARVPDWDGYGPLPPERIDTLRAEFLATIEEHAEIYTLEDTKEEWPAPVALCSKLDRPEPFPFDALGPILGPYGKELCGHVQAPDAVCGGSVLAAASLAVQGHADVCMPSVGPRPLSLFVLSVAESGERKSAVDRECLGPHREHQKEKMRTFKEYSADHAIDLEAYNTAKRATTNKQKNDAVAMRHALEALGAPPAAPLNPTLIVNDGTLQGLRRLLGEGVSAFGFFSDEAGMFLGGFGCSPEQLTQTVSGLSKFWDGSDHVAAFKLDGLNGFGGRRVSLHFMAQPTVIQSFCRNPVARGQGFLARCLMAYPAERAGTRTFDGGEFDCEARDTYRARMTEILARPLPREHEGMPELAPREIELSHDAKDRLRTFQEYLEQHVGTGGYLSGVREFASKTAEHAVRIAGVLRLVENIDAARVEISHIEGGITLAKFYLLEHLRLSAWEGTKPEILDAEKLLTWVQGKAISEVSRREIQQTGPNALRSDRERLNTAIKVLEDHYLLRPLGVGQARRLQGRGNRWEVCAA